MLFDGAIVPTRANSSSPFVFLDVDTSVLPLFGEHEGGVPGPNPRYRGRPSYHPMLARIAETDTIVGAQLRRVDTGLGADDVPTIRRWAARAKRALVRNAALCTRIDSGAECAAILAGLHAEQVFYLVKARITPDLYEALCAHQTWRTTDVDADKRPRRQVAELNFQRGSWITALLAAPLPIRQDPRWTRQSGGIPGPKESSRMRTMLGLLSMYPVRNTSSQVIPIACPWKKPGSQLGIIQETPSERRTTRL